MMINLGLKLKFIKRNRVLILKYSFCFFFELDYVKLSVWFMCSVGKNKNEVLYLFVFVV